MNQIISPLRPQMKNAAVADLQAALTSLGFAIDASERAKHRFGATTRAAVSVFQINTGHSGTGIVDAVTARALNGAIENGGKVAAGNGNGRLVAGTVSHADGTPLGGIVVQAFNRRVGGETPLGVEAATDARGQYSIEYDLPAGISKIDLFVRAFDDAKASIAVSPIAIEATEKQVLDVTVAAARFRGPSEFARLSDAVAAHVSGAQPGAIDANDVALIVRNTSLARNAVTAWLASSRLVERTGIDHESLYGLVRSESTAALPRLARRSPARLRRSLRDAAEANIISRVAGQRANATIEKLQAVKVNVSTTPTTPGSLGALLSTARTATAAQQSTFIRRHAEHSGPIQTLWESLRRDKAFGDAAVDDLQLSLRLGALSANHQPLVEALRLSGVKRASDTALLDRAGWERLLQTTVNGKPVGLPPGIRGATDKERRQNYLTLLQSRTATAFPTTHVAKALRRLPDWKESIALGFLDANPDFNLRTARLGSRLASSDVVIKPEWDKAVLEAELASAQRVMRVAPRGQEEAVVAGLLGGGYTSALAISRESRASFRRKNAGALGGDAAANRVHANAQFQLARAASAFTLMHPSVGAGIVNAIGNVTTTVTTDPTWASLFGNVDFCGCPECRSIHGPAAYFVELLSWLDGHEQNGKTAFERLNERRPDLQRIELSCENTNTVLPYVDLVNEILETRVIADSQTPTSGPPVPQATTATSAELLANPEHVNAAAYDDHLALAVFPHVLPFDLWGALGRVYFEHLGVRRDDLMMALRRETAPRRDAIDAERLRLSMTDWRILIGTARHDTWDYWGYRVAEPGGIDFKKDLANVSEFLRRADISYEQLLDLLHARFVGAGTVRITGSTSNTDEMTLTGLTDEVLERAHRFLRLWRNRGWSILDLDKTLHALDVSTIDEAALARLADLSEVQRLTDVPLLSALSWWAPIDTFPDREEREEPVESLYDRVYLNRAVDAAAEEPDYPLALSPTRDKLLRAVSWNDVRSILQAALAIDAGDLSLLLDESIDGVANPQRVVTGTDTSLEGLSALYRHVSLARTLDVTVADLLGSMRLIDRSPFKPGRLPEALEFIEAAAAIDASDFSLVELQYLLEHDAQAETSVGITDEAIGQTLVEIRDGLARVATDYAETVDPSGDVTAKYLGELVDAATVTSVMTALRTEADAANQNALATTLADAIGGLVTFDATRLVALEVSARFRVLVSLLAEALQDTHATAVIIEKVATLAQRDLDSVQDLLSLRVRMTVDGAARPALAGLRTSPYTKTTEPTIVRDDDPGAFDALRRIHKAALVFNKLNTDIDTQLWLFDVGIEAGLLNPVTLPIERRAVTRRIWLEWERLTTLASLDRLLPGGEPTLVDLLRMLEAPGDPAAAEAAFLASLAARTGWLLADIEALVAIFKPAFPAGWRDGGTLVQLVEAFSLLGRLGVSASQAEGWTSATISAEQAEELRLAAKARHDAERWPAVARALRDPVREQQRRALVAHLIGRDRRYDAEADLYEDLLIDVETAPCMLTSRLKLALSSIQLFVQRAFLNLEPGIEFDRDDQKQWEWMKNFRVWEAARKVFLYPENWIEPELRVGKSPLFTQLENALLQGELDDVAVEKAYTQYLEGLLAIGRLEVMGLSHESESDADGERDILHVVARTRTAPFKYYYRQWLDRREWTPWDEIDADIEGDHVVLAIHDRRLYLLWPNVVQKADSVPATKPDDPPVQTDFYELKLAWIERLHGEWSARRLSTDVIRVNDALWSIQERFVYFRTISRERLTIECLHSTFETSSDVLGRFEIDSASGAATAPFGGTLTVPEHLPPNTGVRRNRFSTFQVGFFDPDSPQPSDLWIPTAAFGEEGQAIGEPYDVHVLSHPVNAVPSNLTWIYPPQPGPFLSQHGVFVDDDERTLHVMPELVSGFTHWDFADTIAPSDVGTTTSESDLFEPSRDEPAFEPELPWDKHQEPPVLATERQRATPSFSGIAIASDVAATATTLSATALGASQLLLDETKEFSDSMTIGEITRYRVSLFYHPYVRDFMSAVRRFGVAGLLDPGPDGPDKALVRQEKSRPSFFANLYAPTPDVLLPYPIQDIDFETGGTYSIYNWELFFHIPLLIACRLSQNQRFDEARRWFHFMFDPTNCVNEADPQRFWKVKPFYHEAGAPIETFLAQASSQDDDPEAVAARAAYDAQVAAWQADPFNPNAIAALRITAYQKTLVMKYLDNLIAWGDQLFRQDTIESLNSATALYVMALELLGERPDALPTRTAPIATTFEDVRAALSDTVLTNPLVKLENASVAPAGRAGMVSPGVAAANAWSSLLFPGPRDLSLPTETSEPSFYFCIPPNDKLLGYWDTVGDRLFKIRNCMNIEGVVRQLPLFEPPIDPGMLVRARAAGIDVSSALADLSAPLPHYRFSVMLQKAFALNQTVRGLGGALLSALEKSDAEALAVLRANHEEGVLEAVRGLKALAIDEARLSLQSAERSLEAVTQRRDYYQRLIANGWLPEEREQQTLLTSARSQQTRASMTSLVGGLLAAIPEIKTGLAGTLSSPVTVAKVLDGLSLAKASELGAMAQSMGASAKSAAASIAGLSGSNRRRAEEWLQQHTLALIETKQIEAQIEAARVRVAMAERDLANHERQIDNSRAVREFMEQKFTNVELYQWMVGQLSSLYFQSYQLAYDLAKQAERAYRHELALKDAVFIQFGYWDSLKKGLLAGERLQYDLERMDKAYLDNNRREYEITKHVSLALADPVALLQLRTTGACEFSVDEALFDVDCPGHYMRRLKSVSVTVPCVVGPYSGLPLQLTLVASRTRIDPSAEGDYAMETAAPDPRFQIETGALQSIVLSHGREDTGIFGDTRDERRLPFEGSGAISDWSLKLTSAVPTFDLTTISDVVLHVRYTAREGGDPLRAAALGALDDAVAALPLRRSFSARSDFPSEFNAFLRPPSGSTEARFAVTLADSLFPRIAQNARLKIRAIELVAMVDDVEGWQSTEVTITTGSNQQAVQLTSSEALYAGQPAATVHYPSGAAPGAWQVTVPIDRLGAPEVWADDLMLVATYSIDLSDPRA